MFTLIFYYYFNLEYVSVDAAEEHVNILRGEFASILELSFAFKRAASRLIEMRSSEYYEQWKDKFESGK